MSADAVQPDSFSKVRRTGFALFSLLAVATIATAALIRAEPLDASELSLLGVTTRMAAAFAVGFCLMLLPALSMIAFGWCSDLRLMAAAISLTFLSTLNALLGLACLAYWWGTIVWARLDVFA